MSDPDSSVVVEPSPLARMLLFVFAGALCFVLAELLHAAVWSPLPGDDGPRAAWFLSTGRSRLLTQAIVAFGVFAFGISIRMHQRLRLACGLAFFIGASVSMTGVLLVREPGTFWPLVFIAAVLYLAAAIAAGLIVSVLVAQVRETRRAGPRPARGAH